MRIPKEALPYRERSNRTNAKHINIRNRNLWICNPVVVKRIPEKVKPRDLIQLKLGHIHIQVPRDLDYLELVKKLISSFQKEIELEEKKSERGGYSKPPGFLQKQT